MVELSDTEDEIKEVTLLSKDDVHVVEIDVSPKSSGNESKSDSEVLGLEDDGSTRGESARKKGEGEVSADDSGSIECPEKKQRCI